MASEANVRPATTDAVEVEERAKNALVSRIRAEDGRGHVSRGRYPPDLDVEPLRDHTVSGSGDPSFEGDR